MGTQTLTLADFLLARIAEDEEVAQERLGPGALSTSFVWRSVQARVLAECEAKRRIIAMHRIPTGQPGVRTALNYLATVYADHPDFDEAWRP